MNHDHVRNSMAECRFGMFIHWGVYAITQWQEQALMRMKMDRSEYEKLYLSFNPIEFHPDEWVQLAVEAGMRYLCFTTKHHDGFCMWDTKQTDYNIMNTPYGRDILAQLVNSCRKHGLKLGLYYSIPDWHQPNAYNPLSTHQIPPRETDDPNMDEYRAYVRKQITELMTNYGEIHALFWDIPPKIDDPSMNEMVRSLQPGIIINNRGFDPGDYQTPEREVPAGGQFTVPTEGCQSIGHESWGYRDHEDYYSNRFLMHSMDQIMAMGGNYLLNVGPKADGSLPIEGIEVIKNIGDWYQRIKASIEGTKATSMYFPDKPYKVTRCDNILYIHLPADTASGIILDPIDSNPKEVVVLNTLEQLPFTVETMPTLWSHQLKRTLKPCLHIWKIPVNLLCNEPIILRITFENLDEILGEILKQNNNISLQDIKDTL